jgi:hypothetical protein
MLAQVVEVLRRERRISCRALRRRLGLDEEYLEDLKVEIIQAKQLATDEDNTILVWAGDATPMSVRAPERSPLTYTPAYLSEKILTTRTALEGERKQVTVLFADIKGSTDGVEIQLRVGLNFGAVVVRAIGDDLHMDYSAVGQTMHLAARMEQLASPGSIRLTADTLRLAEGFVQVMSLGLVPVKGVAEPVAVWELAAAAGHRRHGRRGVVPLPGAAPGGGVPLRDEPTSQACLHLQARPHP